MTSPAAAIVSALRHRRPNPLQPATRHPSDDSTDPHDTATVDADKPTTDDIACPHSDRATHRYSSQSPKHDSNLRLDGEECPMGWFRPMGVESVAYHEETVLGRSDDHPGRALEYYASRGETPLRWGGAGAAALGLHGEVTAEQYAAAFGPGGFRHPESGERLVRTTRPGFEIVVSAHKSVALLGVVDKAEDMHAILDAESQATMGWLDGWFQERGGRRGRASVPTPTGGLVYATTRHGTSRVGDPEPHDHNLVVNVCEMGDEEGGFKALFSASLRDSVEAATMVGRLYSAAEAIRRGYAIELDDGPSGRLRHWRIAGIPQVVCELFSKRSDEIEDHLEDKGYRSYRARGVAARATKGVKRGTGVDELMPRWRAELEAIGWPVERLVDALDEARSKCRGLAPALTAAQIDRITAELLDPEGEFLKRGKVFTRTRLIAEIAPMLYGQDPTELDHVIDRVLASREVVPLIGIAAAREQPYTAAAVLTTEEAIAERIDSLAEQAGPLLPETAVEHAIAAKSDEIGAALSSEQRRAIDAICRSGRAVELIVGVAGAGKTTALDAAAMALENSGYRVLGTATSGQAARGLGWGADIASRTMRSLLWRLEHHRVSLDERTVVILDEAGMTTDLDMSRLLFAVERARAKIVIVGDHRQLASVGPGGAVAAVVDRHPEIVSELRENLRQHDPAERHALAQLRDGHVLPAVEHYARRERIRVAPRRVEALWAMVEGWAADTQAGHDTFMLAWRRSNVADLNRLARAVAQHLDRLGAEELVAPGGKTYAAGDPVVLLAPNPRGELVTSQRGTVVAIHQEAQALTLAVDDGREVTLRGKDIDAEHLDHGYAMTVHRQQGATCDRTHYLADGGGRELAYWPCHAPGSTRSCTRSPTTLTRPSTTSSTTGRQTAPSLGSPKQPRSARTRRHDQFADRRTQDRQAARPARPAAATSAGVARHRQRRQPVTAEAA
jgi:conjugative relaxase-like TrwC/TraI family protein